MNTALNTDANPGASRDASQDIYVVAAHPNWRESHANRPMMESARALPRVALQDLYSS